MSLEAINISFRYGPRFALDDVSLTASPGSVTGLIGPNGSGKTTLIKILCGLFNPDSGDVRLLGKPLAKYTPYDRARHIAYVSQVWRPVFEFTVEQTVLLGRTPWRNRYGGFESDEDTAAADEGIRLMEIESLRYEPITRLSGGELQRVMIAAALAQKTEVLVLDEPTTHLDIAHQQNVLRTLRRIAEDRGLTVLASIHDLNLASIYCDSLGMMHCGKLVAQGTPADVLTPENIGEVFGLELEVEPDRYGDSPAVHYRSYRQHITHGA